MAIKILPEVFATDPDRIARFQREAELLAALNHPNLGSVYGVEESAPVRLEWLGAHEGSGQISPDGRWLAYSTEEDSGRVIFVRRLG